MGAADEDGADDDDAGAPPAAKPDFGLSGALAKDEKTGNMFRGVMLKFVEPDDARTPTHRWRLYVFKGEEQIETLHVHRQSAFLVGREKRICDVLTAHPSCSSQHAVLQFRLRDAPPDPDAGAGAPRRRTVVPYIMDLGSTNGTKLNGKKIDDSRYIELRVQDCLQFGDSTREYVLINAGSAK